MSNINLSKSEIIKKRDNEILKAKIVTVFTVGLVGLTGYLCDKYHINYFPILLIDTAIIATGGVICTILIEKIQNLSKEAALVKQNCTLNKDNNNRKN